MSDGVKRPHRQMMAVAQNVAAWLHPNCERIEIAGSLRRRKPQSGDIELVAIPSPILNMLGEPTDETLVDAVGRELVSRTNTLPTSILLA